MTLKSINYLPFLCALCLIFLFLHGCSGEHSVNKNNDKQDSVKVTINPGRNLKRAMELLDASTIHFFEENGDEIKMARYYNPYAEEASEELGSVWMYTAAIEAVNSVLKSLNEQKDRGDVNLYDENYEKYLALVEKLYDNIDFYLGSYTLTSYTQTKEWNIYAVNRADQKGAANVEGVLNVYDDQMWLIRELLQTYKLTEDEKYLEKAEYLTSYVLDGWDSTLDKEGEEVGGITWGPGYVTKHSCSNGPVISSLVWLSELYKNKTDEITYKYISENNLDRRDSIENKGEYYLTFAKKIYNWQKENLLLDEGVYNDMLGGCDLCEVVYETISGKEYRLSIPLRESVGPPITYNSGSMLSGAHDLFRITGNNKYLDDAIQLSDRSFNYFAHLGRQVKGYYSFDFEGFNNWFNGVLLRAYVEIYPEHKKVINYLDEFQRNLDYAYDNYMEKGILPYDLLKGWGQSTSDNNIESISSFALAAQYAALSQIVE